MKEILKKIAAFVQAIIFVIFLMILIVLTLLFIRRYDYNKHSETGIMKNGNLCISHVVEGRGGYSQDTYISNENIIAEVEKFSFGNGDGMIFGKVYEPINSGKTDLYFGYADFVGSQLNQFELYHIEVDENLNINYSIEIIDEECFEQNIK